MVLGSEILRTTADILKGVNATVWGGIDQAEKVGKIVKTGISGADTVIGISHTAEDLGCNDYFCACVSAIGSVSSGAGMVLGNIPATKHLTVYTGSLTVACRGVRFYCKNYGTVFGCIVATKEGVKAVIKNKLGN